MQRECDIKRIVEEIVSYVTENPDRFFLSLIVDFYSGFDEIRFELLSKVVGNIPDAYVILMADMGFITLLDRERLIALDGQHRLLSLKSPSAERHPLHIQKWAGSKSLILEHKTAPCYWRISPVAGSLCFSSI